jgi:RimJ/RimL family protein N-acetyltransferase
VNPLSAVLAVTLPDNISSNGLLKKIGFCLKGTIEIYGSQSNLYEYSA